ncbi:hypothetical protein TcarDRAFT_1844 [Thermosinus carboxydivorans Nor1]|uniref:Uncharacterized protein n=1 Tax=Thermosinus carboxydivorans Nor1 TaxID=401526 RepID=A1HPJ3_9FIRM|nr:hypothetical protein [Thermosinus carboxydivorans]EAX47966.1 hypothetical protein TcarDRAFT_1844 [Thermosinus carboxydivorans Nor1]
MLYLLLAAVTCVFGAIYSYNRRSLPCRLRSLKSRLTALTRQKGGRQTRQKWLDDLYRLLKQALCGGDQAILFQTADLLKTAFGEGIMRPDEPVRLAGAVIGALRTKQAEIAGVLLDAFRPLLRHQPAEILPELAEGVTMVGLFALKERQNFIAAKAADLLFAVLARAQRGNNVAGTSRAINGIQTLGVQTLRRGDKSLFLELCIRLDEEVINCRGDNSELVGIFAVWLQRLVTAGDEELFSFVKTAVQRLADKGRVEREVLAAFHREVLEMAGMVSLNAEHPLLAPLFEFAFELADRLNVLPAWQTAVQETGKIAAAIITSRGLTAAFPIMAVLLTLGGRLLTAELRRSKAGANEGDIEDEGRVLYLVVRECLLLLELAARQEMGLTAGELTGRLTMFWEKRFSASPPKNIRKFCQLLIFTWMQTRRRVAKRLAPEKLLEGPLLLSAEERSRLYFLQSNS